MKSELPKPESASRADNPLLIDRRLHWEGCFNARDLGGLPTLDGRETRWYIAFTPLSFERPIENGRVERIKYWVPEAMKPQAKDWDEFFN